MSKPKLVTFDVYMALLDIEGSLAPRVARSLALSDEAATSFVRLWRSKQMERAAISNSLEKGRTSFRDATAMALDYVAARHDMPLAPQQRHELIRAWDTLRPWPEANDVVAAIKAKGITTAILSNGDEDMLEAAAAGFSAGFDHILSSEVAGKYKPHPAVYDLPTTQLQIGKSDVIHVAGSANDVLGAVAAGMACIWSNRHGDSVLDPHYPPTHVVSDLSDVPALIELDNG